MKGVTTVMESIRAYAEKEEVANKHSRYTVTSN